MPFDELNQNDTTFQDSDSFKFKIYIYIVMMDFLLAKLKKKRKITYTIINLNFGFLFHLTKLPYSGVREKARKLERNKIIKNFLRKTKALLLQMNVSIFAVIYMKKLKSIHQ